MGQVSNSGIIILCIVGAGAALLIGWAIGHKVWNQEDRNEDRAQAQLESGFTQYEYMRDLRERNKENIAAVYTSHGPKRPRQHSVPLSQTDMSGHSQSRY